MLAETLPPASVGVTVKLYDDLSAAIISGEIAPGAKLSEPAIARRFGVSRAPGRGALRPPGPAGPPSRDRTADVDAAPSGADTSGSVGENRASRWAVCGIRTQVHPAR